MNIDTIITGDSAEVLEMFEPDCVDLTVTSPPYDNLRTYNGYVFDFERIARGLFRVTKPGGVVVWVVGDATVDGSNDRQLFCPECGDYRPHYPIRGGCYKCRRCAREREGTK